jgi:hypothetical protein
MPVISVRTFTPKGQCEAEGGAEEVEGGFGGAVDSWVCC